MASGNDPVTPLDRGSPVAFVRTPDAGVPKAPEYVTKPLAPLVAAARAVATPVPGTMPVGLDDIPADTTRSPEAGHMTPPPPGAAHVVAPAVLVAVNT